MFLVIGALWGLCVLALGVWWRDRFVVRAGAAIVLIMALGALISGGSPMGG